MYERPEVPASTALPDGGRWLGDLAAMHVYGDQFSGKDSHESADDPLREAAASPFHLKDSAHADHFSHGMQFM